MDVDVDIRDGDEETAVDGLDALLVQMKRVLGGMALSTRVERSSGTVHASGEGWRMEVRGDSEDVVFEPAGSTFRIVRRIDDVSKVEARKDSVTFGFGDSEEITLARGVEQRRTYGGS